MKLKTFLFIILYLLIFVVGGYFLYVRYYHSFFSSSQEQNIPQENRQELIYYTRDNNLFQLDPKALTQNPNDIPTVRLQSTGAINQLEIDTQRNSYFYDVLTPSKKYEIWKVNLKDNSSEKLFSKQTPGLENFTNFRDPKLSPDNKILGFLASHDQNDYIFNLEIDNDVLTNLTSRNFPGKITDFSWEKNGNKIALSGILNEKNVIKILSGKTIIDLLEQDNSIGKIEYLKNEIIFSQAPKDTKTTNILAISLKNKKITPMTDLSSPKTVSNFSVSPDGQRLVFTSNDLKTSQNDIYILKTDGTDLLQLTTDNQSLEPVFSPKSSEIAYWSKNTGIFTIQTDKQQKQKILNSEDIINKILTWR